MKIIPYAKQDISEDDIASVLNVLRSDYLTQGPSVKRLEECIREYVGVDYVLAVSNATAALHLSCLAVGLKTGDSLWTSPNSFVASANCALYCGAEVDFVDIELDTYNICVDALDRKLQQAKNDGCLPKVVMVVQYAGQSCNMKAIKGLSEQYGFSIIEDASHAVGAKYNGSIVGSCCYSDIAIFSFHPVKIITTGEGGAILTNNCTLHQKMERLRTSGITRNRQHMQEDHGEWYYEQLDLGFNYRMTDIQAALGCSQFSRLDQFVRRRHVLRENYENLLENFPIKLPKQDAHCYSSLHLYPILVNVEKNRKALFDFFIENGVKVNVHYIPIYKQPYYRKIGFPADYCSNMEYFYKRIITLPLYTQLTFSDQEYIASQIKRYYETSFRHSTVRI